jgi:hypothetical protein
MIVSHHSPPPHVRPPALAESFDDAGGMLVDVRPYQGGYTQAATDLFRQSSFFLYPCSGSWSWSHQGKSKEKQCQEEGIIVRYPSYPVARNYSEH